MKKKNLTIAGLILVFAVFFFLRSKGEGNISNVGKLNGQVQLVDSTTFSKLAKDDKNFLVDVHTPKQTHIPGTDVLIPYNEISKNIDKLPKDKSTPILVYCRSGNMSKSASEEISKLGYTNVYDLEGGINLYKESNAEVVITPSNQDLGEVVYGDIPTTSFIFTNFTPMPVEITRVSTSCGCTKAEVKKKQLGAYESTEVTVSFDPAVHGDATDVGDITRIIYVSTDNPNFPQLTNTITANVVKN